MTEAVAVAGIGLGRDGAHDAFSGRAAKLGALLGLDRTASVVVMGGRWRDWLDDLRGSFPDTRLVDSTEMSRVAPGTIGLALVEADALATLSRDAIAEVLRTLTPSGSLLLFARNRWALRPLVRRPAALLARGVASRWRYRKLLRSAGATRIEEFLPFPELWEAEEMVADRRSITLPSHASRVERLLLASALLPQLHDGFVFIASGHEGGTVRLRDALGNGLHRPGAKLALDRFDLRGRGALVLMVRSRDERLVCRVTTNSETTERVRRNTEWVRRVAGWPGLPVAVRDRLPVQHDVIALGAGVGYTERQVEGIVAWKLAGIARVERVMLRGLHDFSRELARATARVVQLDDAWLSELLPPPSLAVDDETRALVREVHAALWKRLAGESASVVVAHGDYGYGNAIAEPAGALAGVIDWDQGRIDLAGVDLVNFLVQRASGVYEINTLDAFQSVADRWRVAGPRGIDSRLDMADHFPEMVLNGSALLAWTALRFVERSASYPALYASSRADMLALLRWSARTVA